MVDLHPTFLTQSKSKDMKDNHYKLVFHSSVHKLQEGQQIIQQTLNICFQLKSSI
ncbi:unnamed protein product [Paramecium sonneborni]|uniref:Uncharacterized protein n=1 Tax=Paramecium sonneborni TaxID=65129 RepID=A0A8S1PPP9_9CILI|nr:unnamed protein product [Paramecium sonneborni]